VGQVPSATTTIWEQTQVHGERLQAMQSQEQAQASIERTRWLHECYDPFRTRCISMDGGMVYMRDEGWKELKVGVVGGIECHWEADAVVVSLKDLDYRAVGFSRQA
jgi:hypothetical protein